MTTETLLTALVGWVISGIFKYFPILRQKFDLLNGLWKRLIVIAASLIASAAVFALKCGGLDIPILEPCTQAGVLAFASIALTVALNSQAAFLLLPAIKPKAQYLDNYFVNTPAGRSARQQERP